MVDTPAEDDDDAPKPAIPTGTRVIQPIDETLSPKIDIDSLLAKEDVVDMGMNPNNIAATNPPNPNGPGPALTEADIAAQNAAEEIANTSDNPTLTFPQQ
jgi:hypothetical protein